MHLAAAALKGRLSRTGRLAELKVVEAVLDYIEREEAGEMPPIFPFIARLTDAAEALVKAHAVNTTPPLEVAQTWVPPKVGKRTILSLKDDKVIYGDHGDGEEHTITTSEFHGWIELTQARIKD